VNYLELGLVKKSLGSKLSIICKLGSPHQPEGCDLLIAF